MVLIKCPKCYGDGEYYPDGRSLIGLAIGGDEKRVCPLCRGSGYVDDGSIRIRF